jgi:hypothetical protein
MFYKFFYSFYLLDKNQLKKEWNLEPLSWIDERILTIASHIYFFEIVMQEKIFRKLIIVPNTIKKN